MKSFYKKLTYVQVKDLLAIFQFLIALPFSVILKLYFRYRKDELWLICEKEEEARDNGYVFFKYIRENHPDIKVFYAINMKSVDYKKLSAYRNIIKYGGLIHWIYYLAASKNISSHKDGKPNAAVCYLLEVYGILKNTRIFLQHGITLNDSEWLYYKNTKMRLFICGAYPEYLYVKDRFGYPNENVQYLGFPRFDELHDQLPNKKQIVFMPTWRNWLGLKTKNSYTFDDVSDFKETEYYQRCNELINNEKIIKFLEEKNITMYFFPHRNMQIYIDYFQSSSTNVIIANSDEYDIQEMLKNSALMITDYSSVSIDFAYMKKPVIYYQFDIEKFRKGHLGEGYFDYKRDGFGPVCTKIDSIYNEIINSYEESFQMNEAYKEKHKHFFKLYDKYNCARIFEAIKSI
ncbi:CDP-glycerol glycerophosphotransferase family protein [Bacillus kwashiorkori]|uniref:CDP-glycerol glycerophosphotransferase family protein n=1 Tax=Bacillus kwashiorkori TaxID=1522318 RepID=UPI0007853F07|nr:CDP-glycerol glycerophosphotransferase family protein [Bacillus kwashiorkori]